MRGYKMSSVTYTVLFEQAPDGGWGAHVPDLPGIASGAETREEIEAMVREAITLYIQDLKERGLPVPTPQTQAASIEVAA